MDGNPQQSALSPGGQAAAQTQAARTEGNEITRELVIQITDRVWQMLLLEMDIEQERFRRQVKLPGFSRGGW